MTYKIIRRISCVLPIVLTLLTVLSCSADSGPTADELVSQARTYYADVKLRLGDVPGAIEILETARSQAPDGTALLERAMKLAPEMRGLRTRLAFGELAQGRTEQAVSHLESAVELGTDPVTADYYLVQTRIRGGELDEALEAARAFQSRAPDNPAGHLLLADVYAAKGDMDGARRSAERAAQLRPDKPGPLLKLAQLAQRAEDPEGAAGYYQRVLEHDPKNIAAMLALAPHIARIRYHRAGAYARTGKRKLAIRELEELLRSEQPLPEREEGRVLLAELISLPISLNTTRAEALRRRVNQDKQAVTHAECHALAIENSAMYELTEHCIFTFIDALPNARKHNFLFLRNILH